MTAGAAPGLQALWQSQLQADADALAIDGPEARLSRAALETLVVDAVGSLRAEGLGPRDIVAWLGLNTPAMLAMLLACERVGAVFMPLNWRLAPQELLACLQHAGAAALRGTPEMAPARADLQRAWMAAGGPQRQAAEPGDLMLVYTSGTTGEPKGAMHTPAGMAANARAAIAVQGFDASTRTLCVLPMFHVGGLCIQLLPTLMAGGVLRLHARFEPGAWLADVAQWRPTTSLMVPATMRAAIEHPAWTSTDFSSLRFLNSGSSIVPVSLIETFHARGVPTTQVYGSTETGPFSIALAPDEALAHAGSTGVPAPGVQVRLADEQGAGVAPGAVGELWIRGDNVMRGYHRAPGHPSFAEGWFHSGDLARQTPDGHYEVVGRSKDMIISGGENIYPAEIENLVIGLRGVAECAVVGLPDPRWGETPVLVVVCHPGSRLSEGEVRAAYEHRLARFKHPRRIQFQDALPKTALGKVQKTLLVRALAGAGLDKAADPAG